MSEKSDSSKDSERVDNNDSSSTDIKEVIDFRKKYPNMPSVLNLNFRPGYGYCKMTPERMIELKKNAEDYKKRKALEKELEELKRKNK